MDLLPPLPPLLEQQSLLPLEPGMMSTLEWGYSTGQGSNYAIQAEGHAF